MQHDPEDPDVTDVKPLDVHTYPIGWPSNMRAHSVLGMGVIMLIQLCRSAVHGWFYGVPERVCTMSTAHYLGTGSYHSYLRINIT